MGESGRSVRTEFMSELAEALGWREEWETAIIKPSAIMAEIRRLRRRVAGENCNGVGIGSRSGGSPAIRIARFHREGNDLGLREIEVVFGAECLFLRCYRNPVSRRAGSIRRRISARPGLIPADLSRSPGFSRRTQGASDASETEGIFRGPLGDRGELLARDLLGQCPGLRFRRFARGIRRDVG
jgi:hypothetical protein